MSGKTCVPVECVCAERHFILRLHKLHEKRGVEVCPAGQAKHAQQTRKSMPSRRPTRNLEVMSKCFFMSVPSTWLTITGLKRAVSLNRFCRTGTSA